MDVNVFDAAERFPGQPRGEEIVDIADLLVEHIEDIGGRAQVLQQLEPALQVDQAGRLRAHRVVLHQRARPEVAPAQASEGAMQSVDAGAGRDDGADRLRHELAGGIELREARARQRQIRVEGQPLARAVIAGELDAVAPARRPWFGRADVAVVDQFRVKTQRPPRHRRLQVRDRDRADAELRAFGADQRRHAFHRFAADAARDRGAERVVAVEAGADVDVQLGPLPGTDHRAAFRADDTRGGGAASNSSPSTETLIPIQLVAFKILAKYSG